MMLLNNSVALLPMTVLLAAFGEPGKWYLVRDLTPHQWALLVASCVNAGAISWAGINAQAYVTVTTFMVLTNVNKFAVIAFGIFVLGESRSWQAVVGCCTALGGGLLYARARSLLAEARTHARRALNRSPLVLACHFMPRPLARLRRPHAEHANRSSRRRSSARSCQGRGRCDALEPRHSWGPRCRGSTWGSHSHSPSSGCAPSRSVSGRGGRGQSNVTSIR